MPMSPYDIGYSDGSRGLRADCPRGYTAQQTEQYMRGYNQGYDQHRKELYASKEHSSGNYGPYLDSSWIPKDGHY